MKELPLLLNLQQQYNQKDKITFDIDIFFQKLTRLLEKKCVMLWHIKYLENFLTLGINPFGIRVQIFPNLQNIHEDFKKIWESMLLQCSPLINTTLINEYKVRYQTIELEIIEFIKPSEPWRSHAQFLEKDIKLKEHFEGFNKNLIKNKDLKFERDKAAFAEGKAYRWPTSKHNFPNRTAKGRFPGNKTRNDGDSASDSSCHLSVSALSQRPHKKKFNSKNRMFGEEKPQERDKK